MSFRIENKYRLTKSDQNLLKINLIKNGMKDLYPKRIINSCYFDTFDLRSFIDSDEGILPRKKLRLRWYSNSRKITKETKISSLEGRFKISSDFKQYNFLKNYKCNFIDNFYGLLSPKIIISYTREYYYLNKIRITFDSDIKYKGLLGIKKGIYKDYETVMEVKAEINNNLDALIGFIDLPTSRFSKYCRGIELITK